ncbi:hypothetical protein E5D57_001881 [Metarhizium anisopliae]|nr:hypothetical protein E5D57_001881 [Metarhizium anisopliae]
MPPEKHKKMLWRSYHENQTKRDPPQLPGMVYKTITTFTVWRFWEPLGTGVHDAHRVWDICPFFT